MLYILRHKPILQELTSVLGGGPFLGTRLHKIKAFTMFNNPHLDCFPAMNKKTPPIGASGAE